MSVVDREKFLKCVAKCGLLDKAPFDAWVAEIDSEAGTKDLARDLVRKKLATKWQAKMLAKGANRLTLGNFLLTDRKGESEFGDRFLANHRQLSRDVEIQYLPAAACASREARKKIFAFGSKLAELDHPNLAHVYDIDEEKDRVYLVSEFNNGTSLEEYIDDHSKLQCQSVARIVAGCLRGLSFAHSHGVVHGAISTKSIFIKPNGESQVRGLTQFAVQNALAESPAGVDEDLAAVARIGELLLQSVDQEDREGDAFSSVQEAINSIQQESTDAILKLDGIVKVAVANQPSVENEMTLAAETPRAPVASHPAMATASVGLSSADSQASNETEEVPFEDDDSDGFLTSLARRNPVALLAATAACAALMIGGTVFAATHLMASPTQTAVADSVDLQTGPGGNSKKNQKSNAVSDVERPNFRNSQGALSGAVEATSNLKAVTNPDANKAAIDAIFNKSPVKKEVKVEVVQHVAAKVPTEPEMELSEPKNDKEASSENAKGKVAASMPASKKSKAKPDKPKSKGETDVLKAGENPFKGFASVVELPEIDAAEPVSFGRLVLEKNHLLGAEILSTPLAHRSKPIFVMNRSADDKQTWDIAYKKKKRSKPVVIAKLQKTPDELKFNWVAEAAEVSAANYLRNCRVKISTAKHSHWLTLRKPIKIEGFALGKNEGAIKLDVDIPYMPSPAGIGATLKGIKVDKLDKGNRSQKSYVSPAEISADVPARMHFHEDADRFLSLDVLGDVRKKLTLRAALVMQPSPEQPGIVLEDPEKMPQVGQQIRDLAAAAQQQSTQAQASSLKKDEKDAYKRTAKKATDQAELTGYYEFVVPQLLDKDIPVTVIYSLNDQHRIVLAYTVESEETREK